MEYVGIHLKAKSLSIVVIRGAIMKNSWRVEHENCSRYVGAIMLPQALVGVNQAIRDFDDIEVVLAGEGGNQRLFNTTWNVYRLCIRKRKNRFR